MHRFPQGSCYNLKGVKFPFEVMANITDLVLAAEESDTGLRFITGGIAAGLPTLASLCLVSRLWHHAAQVQLDHVWIIRTRKDANLFLRSSPEHVRVLAIDNAETLNVTRWAGDRPLNYDSLLHKVLKAAQNLEILSMSKTDGAVMDRLMRTGGLRGNLTSESRQDCTKRSRRVGRLTIVRQSLYN